jgi:hypothetical protein
MAAVVINPPRSRGAPETRFAIWLRMGVKTNLAESNGRQKPAAQSKFRCLIIEIGAELSFWRAALRITPHFYRRPAYPLEPAGPDGTFNLRPELLALDRKHIAPTETGTL